ncbi:hypothetical protein [Marinobacterium lutimaris]|uniref:Lipoprotein n=1 Tax=Marinobacterium lutimaris TaxID=568106 RepID=A0A1H5YGV9_9GAMM|nr:hypothetical protein [Marinobacterium lutimaris]SEG22915.1 hypothetical protein SAMN05444390_1011744 [Marinobacterium lutimaris]
MRIRVSTLILALALTGCQLKPEIEGELFYQRGLVTEEGGEFSFRLCRDRQWYSQEAPPRVLTEQYAEATQNREGLAVYVEGWGVHSPVGWQLLQPRVIGGDLNSCREHIEGAALRAFGVSPNWVADLSDTKFVLREAERLRTLGFTDLQFIRDGNTWRWRGDVKRGRNTLNAELMVFKRPCFDTADTWYFLTAELYLEGQLFRGCARYGDLGRLDLASRYSTPPDTYLRDLYLLLRADGRARLLIDNHTEDQSLDVRTGHWRRMSSGRLLVETEGDGGNEDTLLWSVEQDGSIRLLTDDPNFGRGLQLVRSGVPLQWPQEREVNLP